MLPYLEWGGAQKVSDPGFSDFLAPPPSIPIINDRYLRNMHFICNALAVQLNTYAHQEHLGFYHMFIKRHTRE